MGEKERELLELDERILSRIETAKAYSHMWNRASFSEMTIKFYGYVEGILGEYYVEKRKIEEGEYGQA